jgi:hypothetical protein
MPKQGNLRAPLLQRFFYIRTVNLPLTSSAFNPPPSLVKERRNEPPEKSSTELSSHPLEMRWSSWRTYSFYSIVKDLILACFKRQKDAQNSTLTLL